jgi:sugar diacid utilization regulator
VEVTHDVSRYIVMKQLEEKSVNDLLENILFNQVYDFPTIIRRASYYGYDLSKPHRVGIVRASDFDSFLKEHQDEEALMKLKERFERAVREILAKHYKKALSMARVDSIIFLMPEKTGRNCEGGEMVAIAEEIVQHCSLRLSGLTLNIGLGNCFTALEYAKNSFDQARLALKFAGFIRERSGVYRYDNLGVHKLLLELESQTLEDYYRETMGELVRYDKEHGMDLVATLLVYLQENGNAIQAARKLFIHKNTLSYRIKKIEKLTGRHLDNMHDRLTLQMGLLIGRQLEPL